MLLSVDTNNEVAFKTHGQTQRFESQDVLHHHEGDIIKLNWLKTGIEVDREQRLLKEGVPNMSESEKRDKYNLNEAEERAQKFCNQIQT